MKPLLKRLQRGYQNSNRRTAAKQTTATETQQQQHHHHLDGSNHHRHDYLGGVHEDKRSNQEADFALLHHHSVHSHHTHSHQGNRDVMNPTDMSYTTAVGMVGGSEAVGAVQSSLENGSHHLSYDGDEERDTDSINENRVTNINVEEVLANEEKKLDKLGFSLPGAIYAKSCRSMLMTMNAVAYDKDHISSIKGGSGEGKKRHQVQFASPTVGSKVAEIGDVQLTTPPSDTHPHVPLWKRSTLVKSTSSPAWRAQLRKFQQLRSVKETLST